MEPFINSIPFSMVFILAVIGVLIFMGFRLYRRLILPIMLLKESGKAHQRSLDRVEIIIWGVYAVALVYQALVTSLPVTVVLLGLILFAFFDFWRNYFSGIVLKFSDKLQLGDAISLNGHTGSILEFGSRDLKIIGPEGEKMLIPYRLVNTEVKIGQKSLPEILYKTFVVELSANNPVGVRQKMEKALYSNPWIILSSPVSVALEDQRATLRFYVLNNDFFEKAKYRLLRDLEG